MRKFKLTEKKFNKLENYEKVFYESILKEINFYKNSKISGSMHFLKIAHLKILLKDKIEVQKMIFKICTFYNYFRKDNLNFNKLNELRKKELIRLEIESIL